MGTVLGLCDADGVIGILGDSVGAGNVPEDIVDEGEIVGTFWPAELPPPIEPVKSLIDFDVESV